MSQFSQNPSFWATLALALCLVSDGLAQSARPQFVDNADLKAAAKKQSQLRYAEALDLYSAVAFSDLKRHLQRKDSTATMRTVAFDQGVVCSLKSGNRQMAAALLDSLIEHGMSTPAQWNQRFELALSLGEDDVASQLVKEARTCEGLSMDWTQSANARMRERDELRQTVTPATVSLIRPKAKFPEFGAVPFNEGLAYVSSGLGAGFAPGKDGWTGRRYNQLGYIANVDSAKREVSGAEKLVRSDVLSKDLLGPYHNGPLAVGMDGRWLLLTQSQLEPSSKDSLGQGVRKLRLRLFETDGSGEWENAVERTDLFPYNDVDANVGHAAMDTLGNLIFSSDREGGRGGMDLWMSKWSGEAFEEPVNLGDAVNTVGDEVFPFVNAVNQLYYASNGVVGYGGLDVFKMDLAGGSRKLLGPPVNSSGDDFALCVNEFGVGYLSSDREEGMDHIYALRLHDVFAEFEVQFVACDGLVCANLPLKVSHVEAGTEEVVLADSVGAIQLRALIGDHLNVTFGGNDTLAAMQPVVLHSPIETTVRIRQTMTYVPGDNTVRVLAEGANNESSITVTFVNDNGENVQVSVSEDETLSWGLQQYATHDSIFVDCVGFSTAKVPLRNQESCPRPESFEVQLKQSIDIDLEMVLYDLNKADLRPVSIDVMDKIVQYMNNVPYLNLQLESHTDCRGSDDYNMALSQRRAQSCVDYIIASGISSQRIRAIGYGETRLTNGCSDGVRCTEAQHQLNRRTVITPVLNQ